MVCVFKVSSLSIYTAEEVLKEYRDRFIADIDANAVVNEFLNKGIIPKGVQRNISKTDCPKLQNEILHDCLLTTCTNEALMTACGIITSVQGNPRMSALGNDIQMRLQSGVCVCVCVCAHLCAWFVRVCVCVCVCVCNLKEAGVRCVYMFVHVHV